MDGIDVLAALRHNLRTKDVPILLLTARRAEGDVARGLTSGANDYVTKPFRPSELAMRVGRLIEQSQVREWIWANSSLSGSGGAGPQSGYAPVFSEH